MSLEEKASSAAKNVEGKVQETVGKMTGDPATQAEGKAKQAEAESMKAKEDVSNESDNIDIVSAD
jgi:uncharacterized protein YjbJ (UPF0337 family)